MKRTKEEFIKEVLVLNGVGWKSHAIKLELFKFGLKERKCEKCGQDEIWFGEKLSLQLDHKNGNHKDNRFENLEILCPNCHSQTPTYSGKRNNKGRKKYNESQNRKCACGNSITNRAKECKDCYHKHHRRVERPSIEILKIDINNLGYTRTGIKYGVSDNTIRKWIKADVPELAYGLASDTNILRVRVPSSAQR